jgi:hypothetical protein
MGASPVRHHRQMPDSAHPTWRDHLILNRDVRTDSARADLARRCARGELARVSSGAYLPSELWQGMGERERFLTAVRVVAAKADDPMVFSHASAAVIWGLPWFGPWPERVDILRTEAARGHYAAGVSRHAAQSDDAHVVIDGLAVTSLARTVVDLACQRGFIRSVVVGDAALHRDRRRTLSGPAPDIDVATLLEELARGSRAPARARDVIGFMDARSDSPGESISRVSMWRAGVPTPVLQQRFAPYTVDFWWPEFGVIGEFDGALKYLDPAMRGGRSAERVVYDEKLREDELRRRSKGFARWGYSHAMAPGQLADRLRDAGVKVGRRTRFPTL